MKQPAAMNAPGLRDHDPEEAVMEAILAKQTRVDRQRAVARNGYSGEAVGEWTINVYHARTSGIAQVSYRGANGGTFTLSGLTVESLRELHSAIGEVLPAGQTEQAAA